MRNEAPKKQSTNNEWFVMGIALGVMFGIIFENISLWLPIGVCAGLIGPALKRMNNKNNKNKNNNNEPNKE